MLTRVVSWVTHGLFAEHLVKPIINAKNFQKKGQIILIFVGLSLSYLPSCAAYCRAFVCLLKPWHTMNCGKLDSG